MPYRLRDDLSYCYVDGGLIFQDVDQDRYFRLSDDMEQALIALLESDGSAEADVRPLVEANILANGQPEPRHQARLALECPRRSLVEGRSSSRRIPLSTLIESFAIVCATQWQLKRRRLKHVLDALVAYRREHASSSDTVANDARQLGLTEAVEDFRRSRRYVPVDPICLLDSLAMTRFLAKRGLHANIVFGVTSNPFSAHCWVQAGDLALNDTVGHTSAFVQIRVV
ncbi:lasso peptide biosynthesis B2 protein [Pseudoxanthomonas sp. X-1]|uniref:lasso peptide biosynthesis B2 protein n=1 Tax=Pseudoxanthomonas sp. X-1 TaxID=2571115 RepID=UPI00110A1A05|nr:lasso peptide biosynthesis B2 protein [Pseudoxanthomonas sp. X-1]TMN24202.1 lasso peptide biosynthesis B2 protein [Pseudoxanthomonas sp. X-1]UAY75166.1 lasso peptide biosynthesis B2 protein [Pseudoxanthomonas sp. X-1]